MSKGSYPLPVYPLHIFRKSIQICCMKIGTIKADPLNSRVRCQIGNQLKYYTQLEHTINHLEKASDPDHCSQFSSNGYLNQTYYYYLQRDPRSSLIQEEAVFRILYHPLQPFCQVFARHRTAWKNCPLVCFDEIQTKTLH